jgi:type II secretory pathway pseudopilin PulG
MIAVTVLLISLTAVLPDIYTEGQRAREEELIFRGNEYARAIALFHARFNRYPMKIDDLVKGMNGIRFLRHAYPDPMTRSGKWRYIHANGAGVVVDSRIFKNLINMTPGGAMGGPGGGMGSGFSQGMTGGFAGAGPGFGTGTSGGIGGGVGFEQGGGQPEPNPPMGGSVAGGENPQGTTPTSSTSPSQTGSAFSNGTAGLSIVGVASTSHNRSFRILNKQKYYDDWEFLGIPSMISGVSGTIAPAPAGTSGTQRAPAVPPILGTPTSNP